MKKKLILLGILFFATGNLFAQIKDVTAKSSSVNFGGVASRAIDKNTNGLWDKNSVTHTQDEVDPWLELNLGSKKYIMYSMKIWNRTDECCWNRLQGFYVMTSPGDITENSTKGDMDVKVFGPYSFEKGQKYMDIEFKDAYARNIRIFIPGQKKILSIAEIELSGSESEDN
jgi:hypothetical protein